MDRKFIHYDFLPTLADYVLDQPKQRYLSAGITPKHNYPLINISKLKDNDTIFVKTDLLVYFFKIIYPKITTKFILLTGVSDYSITPDFLHFLNDDKITKWVGVNICINHSKILKIPIGFQEPERRRGGPADYDGGDQKLLEQLYKNKKEFANKNNQLLVTYVGSTNPARAKIVNNLRNKIFIKWGEKLDFENYMKIINDYKFVLCPAGNGIDTHRFCEVLLMGSIPVVERSGITDFQEQFPCIIVDKFSDLTKEILDSFVLNEEKLKNVENYLLIENFINKIFLSMCKLKNLVDDI